MPNHVMTRCIVAVRGFALLFAASLTACDEDPPFAIDAAWHYDDVIVGRDECMVKVYDREGFADYVSDRTGDRVSCVAFTAAPYLVCTRTPSRRACSRCSKGESL